MTRSRRTSAQVQVNYAVEEDSDEEQGEEADSGDEECQEATNGSDDDEEDAQFVDDVQESLPRKRACSAVVQDKQESKVKAKGKGRARAGKLQLMVELPVDIWFMIAEHLDPPSLLYLGRANKMMRSLFASKSKSQGLWNVVKRSAHAAGPMRYYSVVDTAQVNEKILVFEAAIERAVGKKQEDKANEALLQFIDSRQKVVAGSSRDAEKLVEWERLCAAERKAADRAACQARSNDIKAKLLELGHDERDFERACRSLWGDRDPIWQPAALTPQIWKKISAKVIEEVESSKQVRLGREASARRNQVRPYYEALQKASNGQYALPAFGIFATLPAVRPFWKEEDSTVDDLTWQRSLDEIKAQIPQARRRIQLEFARELVKAYDDVKAPFPESLRLSIHPQQTDLFRYDTPDRQYLFAEINLQDSSTISEQDLDALLSRFTSTFSAANRGYDPPFHWTSDYINYSLGLVQGGKCFAPRHWLRTQLSVLSQTGLADSEETENKLQELGACFHCENCHENTSRMWLKPQTGPLTWKEMVKHAFGHHSVHYYSDESTVWISYKAPIPQESPLNEPWSCFWNRALDAPGTG
ncbi:hypothetical protein JCM5350_003887 [Sporobolomyces pararoseus]